MAYPLDACQAGAEVRGLGSARIDAEWKAQKQRGIGMQARIDADDMILAMTKLLYPELSYKIRGACFAVWKNLGPAFKEIAYHKSLGIEFGKSGLSFESEKNVPIIYEGTTVGRYQPDFVIEDKVLLEIKSVPFLTREHKSQFWHYLKGSPYKVGFLVNFGGRSLQILRRVYDTARNSA